MYIFILIVVALILIFRFFSRLFNWLFVKRCFRDGNVIVTGLRGKGKDLLFSCVINASKSKYISNVDYTGDLRYMPFKVEDISVGHNTFENFANGIVIPYKYPYPDGVDYYISDVGIYFPSQEFSRLNKFYASVPVFQALSRHLGDCNFHCNVQNLNRLWDKIREQADSYIRCARCRVRFHRFASFTVYYYDRYQSCVDRVKPMRKRWGRLGKLEYDKFTATYGTIKRLKFRRILRYPYDSRRFKTMLEEGLNEEEEQVEMV